MTEKKIRQLECERVAVRHDIDNFLERLWKKSDTLQRIKIRGVQKNINKLIEIELLLEAESNK